MPCVILADTGIIGLDYPAVADPNQPSLHPPERVMLRFDCPACGKRLKMPPDAVGRAAHCPYCRSSITTPGIRTEAPLEPEETSSPDDAADIEQPDEPPVAEPNEPEDPDYVPPRRRKGWRVSPLGMVIVGGLGLAVLIALGGVAVKLRTTGSKATTTVKDRPEESPYFAAHENTRH